jgi:uncharacterized protein (DUF2225 family)
MPKFWGANPLPHFVHVCPVCKWADYAGAFEPSQAKIEYEEPKMPAWKKFTLVAEQLAKTHQTMGLEIARIAWAYMQGAWSARVVDRLPEKEQICLKNALKYFKLANSHDSADRAESVYMCGEISRLLGDFNDAIRYLQLVPKYANEKDKQKGLLSLSQEQIAAARTQKTEVMIR